MRTPAVNLAVAAATQGELPADDRICEQAAVSASVTPVFGPAFRGTAANGAGRRRAGGVEADREGGRFRAGLVMPSWRRRTTRDVLAAGDAERERIERDLHDGSRAASIRRC
jgi:hypothetical protein